MATVTRAFRGISADDRLAQRRVDLVRAGFEEIAEVGVAQLRMNTVCARAGLNQRYFYEHFGNRDELLAALFDNLADDLITRTVAAAEAAGPDLYDQAGAALAVFYDTVMMDAARARLYAEASGIPAVADRKRDAVQRYSEFVLQRATAVVGKLDARTRARVTMAVLVLVGGQADAAVALASGAIKISRNDYIDQHAQMLIDAIAAATRPPRKAPRREPRKENSAHR